MRHVTITIHAAFHDADPAHVERTEDAIADSLVNYLIDGQEAEIAYTTRREAIDHPELTNPEPDEAETNGARPYFDLWEVWQIKARKLMEKDHERKRVRR